MSSIDYDKIRTKARAEVDAELAEVTDPRERRALAEEIRDQAFMELSMLKEERQQLVASAALYEYAHDLHEKFGIARTHLRRLTMTLLHDDLDRDEQINPPSWPTDRVKAARKAGLPHYEDAVQKAAAICARYEEAAARRSAARSAARAPLEDAEVLRTASGRVEVGPLERPDFAAIRHEAQKGTWKELLAADGSPEDCLRRAAEAVDLWEEKAAELLPKRDAAICSLAFYTTARGIYYSAGITRNACNRVLARALNLPSIADIPKRAEQPAAARAADVRYLKTAERMLPKIAKEYEVAKARQAAAIKVRNQLIPVMSAEPYNWEQFRIADAIDRDEKVVRRVLAADEST